MAGVGLERPYHAAPTPIRHPWDCDMEYIVCDEFDPRPVISTLINIVVNKALLPKPAQNGYTYLKKINYKRGNCRFKWKIYYTEIFIFIYRFQWNWRLTICDNVALSQYFFGKGRGVLHAENVWLKIGKGYIIKKKSEYNALVLIINIINYWYQI